MNKMQKVFLMCWIPVVFFIGFNVWSFLTPGSIAFVKRIPTVLGWDHIVAFIVIASFYTLLLYLGFSDKSIQLGEVKS